MKRLLENFKEQLLDPKVSDERASNLSGFITSGYECGCDNRWRMERYYREIIYKVEMFRAMLTKDEAERLPDGVMRRMDMAYTEAKAYEKEYCVSAS